ncbi:replication factor A1 [Nematocida homosporus]|uniref:replication factor A1 n=1 Tax=Nematocida homosporus TaxID=1912981 RepID=UPI0022200598|nr:replication factor A1 [Nematocida homosporus]KAI5184917.1 replication factor A1 [Nematocida homosporus]
MIQQTRGLQPLKGSLAKTIQADAGLIRTIPLVVKIQDIFLNNTSEMKERIQIEVSDNEQTMRCLLSAKYQPAISDRSLSIGSVIRVGDRLKVRMLNDEFGLYFKEILEMGSTAWLNPAQSPSKRKEPESPRKELKRTITTIAELSPLVQNGSWSLRVKVTRKTKIKSYTTATGEGKLFKIGLMDRSGSINMTFFNEQVDSFYERIEANSTYEVAGGSLKVANRSFGDYVHTYELVADRGTAFIPADCEAEIIKVPSLVKISAVRESIGLLANLMVAVVHVPEVIVVRRRDGAEVEKRALRVIDESEVECELVLWGEMAKSGYAPDDIILLQQVKVGEFAGNLQLSPVGTSVLSVNPAVPEAFSLGGWFRGARSRLEQGGVLGSSSAGGVLGSSSGGVVGGGSGGELLSLADVKAEARTTAQVRCTVMHIGETTWYDSCARVGCNKKVSYDSASGAYVCPKCEYSAAECKKNYNILMLVGDATDQMRISAFQKAGVSFFGVPAETLASTFSEDSAAYMAKINGAIGTEIEVSLRGRSENYKGEPEMRYTAEAIHRVVYRDAAHKLLTTLRSQ